MKLQGARNLRLAVIGTGHLGRIHAKLLAARKDCELVAACDPYQPSRDWVESNLNIPTFANHELLEGQVDAIVVATPTIQHAEVARWALSRGIATLIEKPIASTVAEAIELTQVAREKNTCLQVGHVERFNPVWESLCSRIDRTKIHYFESRREGVYTGRSTDIGIVLDLMIHDLDLVLSLMDCPIASIRATGRRVLGAHEDLAIADIEFQNGARAHLRASRISSSVARTMEIQTENEWFDIDFATGSLTAIKATPEVSTGNLQADRLGPEDRAKVKDELFTRWLDRMKITPESANAIAAEHSDFFHAILTGRQPRVPGTAGLAALQIATEITAQISAQTAQQSTKKSRPVSILASGPARKSAA